MIKVALKEYDKEEESFQLINGENGLVDLQSVPGIGEKIAIGVDGLEYIFEVKDVMHNTSKGDIELYLVRLGNYAEYQEKYLINERAS